MKFWLYYFLKFTLGIPFRVISKQAYLDGLEHIPKGKPVLFACNHPDSFLDGVVLEYFLRRKVYTMVRGDMFKKPVANNLLRSMRLLPIFRARDAKASVAREGNNSTYDECFSLFQKNEAILIFSEGISYPEKKVRRFKNGTAAMALEMFKRGNGELDLHIVPCGLNYSRFDCKRGRIHLSFAPAIKVADLGIDLAADNRTLIPELTSRLQDEVTARVVVSSEDEELSDFEQDIALNECTEPVVWLHKEQRADTVAPFISSNSDQTRAYNNALKKYKVDDRNVQGSGLDYVALFLALFSFAVSLPVFLIYKLFWYGGKKFVDVKVKNPVFKDSIYFGFGVIATYLIFTIVLVIAFNTQTRVWAYVVSLLCLTGMMAWIRVLDEWPILLKELRYLSFNKAVKAELQDLRKKALFTLKR
ncbi:hypothetical protein GYB22_12975 [bacterium]|nr:hypothetical protein [bacterium]